MTKTYFSILLFTCFTCFSANSQSPSYIAVSTAQQIPWEQYTPSDKRFIVAGEAHHIASIYPFQLSHLKYLVKKGFRHLVWEVPFSYSIIAQQYISTGNDSLFKLIGGYVEVEDYWKEVYKLNQTLPENDKLQLWGIDHELGDKMGEVTYRATLFKKALLLLAEGKGSLPAILQQEYLSLGNAVTVKDLTDIKNRLQQMQHDEDVARFFGKQLPYFQILVNRLDHYKVNRNDEMLDAFKEICSSFHLDSSAKFLGRFGWGHTNKSHKNSISWMLENDVSSPVKNSTYVIGVQYLNCTSFGGNNRYFENEGVVNDRAQKKNLAALNQQDSTSIKIFNWPSGEKRRGWSNAADVLFVFSGFPGITPIKLNYD